MLRLLSTLLLGLCLSPLATSAPSSRATLAARQEEAADADPDAAAVVTLLIGGGPSGTIATAEFDGAVFTIVANNTMPGTSASWLLPRGDGSGDVYAVDENSATTRLFSLNPAAGTVDLVQNATGSPGVVFLEFGAGATRIVGSAFGSGRLDVWDVSAPDGSLALLRQIESDDALGPNTQRQDAPHPHQAILDPTGRFFVANDLGTDTVLVIDSADDAFAVTNRVRVQPPGCGPRHGVFFPPSAAASAAPATHYIMVCEMLNLVQVFEVTYAVDTLQLRVVQTLSTFGADSPPANASTATAGEVQLSIDGRDLYVSSRNTGNETDSIAHFSVDVGVAGEGPGTPAPGVPLSVAFRESVSCGGTVPRMFSLAQGAGRFVFSANQDGELGLVAFRRNADGSLDPAPAASLPLGVFGPPGFGPQFVLQI